MPPPRKKPRGCAAISSFFCQSAAAAAAAASCGGSNSETSDGTQVESVSGSVCGISDCSSVTVATSATPVVLDISNFLRQDLRSDEDISTLLSSRIPAATIPMPSKLYKDRRSPSGSIARSCQRSGLRS